MAQHGNSDATAGHGTVIGFRLSHRVPVVDPRLFALLEYWDRLRAEMIVPDRREFDPTEVVEVLPFFWILDRDPTTGQHRFALAGEETLRLLGRRLVGALVADVFPDNFDEIEAAIVAVLRTPAVLHTIGPLYGTDRATVHIERLALPMRTDDEIDRVYGATIYKWPSRSWAPVGGARYAGKAKTTIVSLAAA